MAHRIFKAHIDETREDGRVMNYFNNLIQQGLDVDAVQLITTDGANGIKKVIGVANK